MNGAIASYSLQWLLVGFEPSIQLGEPQLLAVFLLSEKQLKIALEGGPNGLHLALDPTNVLSRRTVFTLLADITEKEAHD
jgi:hypothetical protein